MTGTVKDRPRLQFGPRLSAPLLLLTAAFGGLALGLIARIWMRWISTEPDFSWSGTISILASFGVFVTAQAGAAVVRRRNVHAGSLALARVVSAVLTMGLFAGAGLVMLPTVFFGSLALWRPAAPRALRIVFALLALPAVALVVSEIASDFGWTVATMAKALLFIAIYLAVIAATWPTTWPRTTVRVG